MKLNKMLERRCTYCRKILELSPANFTRVKTKGFRGFGYTCKECDKKRVAIIKSKRIPEPGSIRKRYLERRTYLLNYYKEYSKNNQEKIKAKLKARQAIKKGELKKEPCEFCGSIKSEAHHPDYSKPLEVMWVCHKHHMQLHSPNFEELFEPALRKLNLIKNNVV